MRIGNQSASNDLKVCQIGVFLLQNLINKCCRDHTVSNTNSDDLRVMYFIVPVVVTFLETRKTTCFDGRRTKISIGTSVDILGSVLVLQWRWLASRLCVGWQLVTPPFSVTSNCHFPSVHHLQWRARPLRNVYVPSLPVVRHVHVSGLTLLFLSLHLAN